MPSRRRKKRSRRRGVPSGPVAPAVFPASLRTRSVSRRPQRRLPRRVRAADACVGTGLSPLVSWISPSCGVHKHGPNPKTRSRPAAGGGDCRLVADMKHGPNRPQTIHARNNMRPVSALRAASATRRARLSSPLAALQSASPACLPSACPACLPSASPGCLPSASPGCLPSASPACLPGGVARLEQWGG